MKYLLFILSILGSFFLNAQTSNLFDTIQVTALNIPLKSHETGRSISIIKSDELMKTAANSIDEILQTVMGVEVQSRGAFGAQGDIIMRGSTFTQVLILIDGMKLNDPLTGHFNSNIPVTLPEIERIEILRGTGSAIFGPDAVGGVINIVTKTFANKVEKLNVNGEFGYGEYALLDGFTGFYRGSDKVKIGGGVSIKKSDGPNYDEKVIDSTTTLEAYNSYFDIKTFGVSAGFNISPKWSVTGRTSFDSRDFDARYYYTTSTFDKSTEIVNNWFNHVQLKRTSDKSTSDFNMAYKRNTDEFIFSPDFPSTNTHTSRYLNMTANHFYPVNEKLNLKTGIQIDRRSIESNDRGTHQDWHYGLYGLAAYRMNAFHAVANVRADYDENYKLQFLPSLNLSYAFQRIVMRGSIGKSIRAADYTERYVSNNLQDLTPGRSLGNPDLSTEISWSADIGTEIQILPNWTLSSSIFGRIADNLIDYVSTNESEIGAVSEIGNLQENADYFFAKNISNVTTTGFEIASDYHFDLGQRIKGQWNFGYSNQSSKNEDEILSIYLSNAAKHLITNRINLKVGPLEIGVSHLYKDREGRVASGINSTLSASYHLWNAEANFYITKAIYIGVEARNVFDSEYQNILGATMPGRWLKGQIGWSF